jgi:hypothetical protein
LGPGGQRKQCRANDKKNKHPFHCFHFSNLQGFNCFVFDTARTQRPFRIFLRAPLQAEFVPFSGALHSRMLCEFIRPQPGQTPAFCQKKAAILRILHVET